MIFGVGLLLAPVGGLIGALMIAAISAVADTGPLPADFLSRIIRLGVTLGAIYAAPATAIVLPFAHLRINAAKDMLQGKINRPFIGRVLLAG